MKSVYSILLCKILVVLVGLSACQTTVETKTITITETPTTVTTTVYHPSTVTCTTVVEISWLDIPAYNQYSDVQHQGKIDTGIGEEFAIALFRQPRLGVDWFVTYDEDLLVLLESAYKVHATDLMGANGDQYFIFRALKMGMTEITFDYKHVVPEADILDQKIFQIEIQ
jgi:predicted secreted protein